MVIEATYDDKEFVVDTVIPAIEKTSFAKLTDKIYDRLREHHDDEVKTAVYKA